MEVKTSYQRKDDIRKTLHTIKITINILMKVMAYLTKKKLKKIKTEKENVESEFIQDYLSFHGPFQAICLPQGFRILIRVTERFPWSEGSKSCNGKKWICIYITIYERERGYMVTCTCTNAATKTNIHYRCTNFATSEDIT